MVELIGVITISALVSLLAWFMAGESDAERRKSMKGYEHPLSLMDREGRKEKPFKLAA